MTPRKIDKSHGFMQSIIKNQVLRNEYDIEQKTLASQKPQSEGGTSSSDNSSTADVRKMASKRERVPRKGAMQLYVPPHLKKRGNLENEKQSTPKVKREMTEVPQAEVQKRLRRSSSRRENQSRILFTFEYEEDGGEVRSILVKEDDNAEDLAETFGCQLGLTKPLRKALKHKLQQEIRNCTNS